jgi:hypothetical protein
MYVTKATEVRMYENGGHRERFAMSKGNRRVVYIGGHLCFKFTYAPNIEYQDGNGATYDTVTETWID